MRGAVLGNFPFQFLGYQHDCREGRAELVGGCRRQPVKRRQALLTRQDKLGGGKRLGHLPRLLLDAPGVNRDEHDARHQRGPEPDQIVQRQDRRLGVRPGQGQVIAREDGGEDHGKRSQHGCDNKALRRCRDRDRNDEQESKRIFEAAGQEKERRQLQDIVAEEEDRGPARKQQRARIGDAQDRVQAR